MDIRCRKTKCIHNDRYTCKARKISINRGIVCGSYERGAKKPEIDSTKHLFEKPPVYAPQRDSKTAEIVCRANCLFNKNGMCVSNGITVNAISEKPYCVSYLEK